MSSEFVLKDEPEIQQWILRRMGAPLLKVELTQDHLNDNVQDAKRWFAAKKGWRRFKNIDLVAGINEYTLDLDVDVVLDFTFSFDPLDLSLLAYPYWISPENNQVPYSVFSVAGQSGGLYSNYAQTLQFIETAKRTLSADADWRQEGQTLYVFPNPTRGGKGILEYNSHTMSPLTSLSERDHDLIKRYALAKAKADVGRIRSKFDSYPTAQGTASMDGVALLQESKDEVDALNEEIADSAMPMAFITG